MIELDNLSIRSGPFALNGVNLSVADGEYAVLMGGTGQGKTTILEAIAMAGGFGPFASPSKITVFRKDAGGATQRIRFNYNRALSGGDENNLTLKPGDVIVVP